MTKIRVIRDEKFSGLMHTLGANYPSIQEIMDASTDEPMEPGTEIDEVRITESGRARFLHPESGTDWYLPKGWYEVIDD